MQTEQFESWLRNTAGLSEDTIRSRLSNCRKLKDCEGDLDVHFAKDRLEGLLARLTYSRADERSGAQPQHLVPIKGNIRNGTATLKYAANLYKQFREDGGKLHEHLTPSPKRHRSRRERTSAKSWPEWGQPKDEDILKLAEVLTPLVKFLHPDIVAAVAEDNRQRSAEWRDKFEEMDVDPDIYLWCGSPCAFPGVRRYIGKERDRKGTASTDSMPPNCLKTDDNTFPKHLWAFVLTGKKFQNNKGPKDYQLAHLADHQEYKNRWCREFSRESEADPPPLFGLYTSPANAAYVPKSFLKPTDFVGTLRALLLRMAYRLYGGICRLAPPPLVEKKEREDSVWNLNQFTWSDPVGATDTDNVDQFLKYRHKMIDKAFHERR